MAGGGQDAATPRLSRDSKSKRSAASQPQRARIGLAMAGGGPLGAIYEIGALAALAESLDGVDFTKLDIYVGVSAGSFIAAGLANGITPAQMCAAFIESDDPKAAPIHRSEIFDPALLLRPAFKEYWQRMLTLPPLLAGAAWNYAVHPQSVMASFERLGRAIPTGVFSGTGIDRYLSKLFSRQGRTNQFKHLRSTLRIVATDLDSGEAVTFGAPGHDDLPISLAVQASAALPGLFPPVEINGRAYVDGALRKTLHASVALKHGVDLLLCLNPLVPFNADAYFPPTGLAARMQHKNVPEQSPVVAGGLPTVLSQTFRSIIHSRMEVGMERYRLQYPHSDIVLFEPNHSDPEIFFTNLFSYSQRRRLCEYAYQHTRGELYRRRHEIGPRLARHGVHLRLDVLTDPKRTLVSGARPPLENLTLAGQAAARLSETLDDLDRWLKSMQRG
ncbi:MAG TPA: patatin-like phospholipase family protein [Burkholderiaceae bacterium]|nr:patatin-like phospholipase family protein [Burkholderiaceae bacterium]